MSYGYTHQYAPLVDPQGQTRDRLALVAQAALTGQVPPTLHTTAPELAQAAQSYFAQPTGAPSSPAPQTGPALADLYARAESMRQAGAQQGSEAAGELGYDGPIETARLGGLQNELAGLSKQAAAKTQASEAQAGVYGDAARGISKQEADYAENRKRYTPLLERARQQADYLSDEANRAEARDFWANKSTGSRLLGVISQTLAGAANGLAGTPGAPSAVDRLIEQDFLVQKANLANKRDAAYRAEGALNRMYNNMKSEDEAHQMFMASAYKQVGLKIQQVEAAYGGPQAQAEAQKAMGIAQQKYAEHREEFARLKAQQGLLREQAGLNDEIHLAGVEAQRDSIDHSVDKNYRDIPGLKGRYYKDTLTETAKNRNAAYSQALSNLDGILAGLSDPDTYKSWVRTGQASTLLLQNNRVIGQTGAALSAEELKNIQRITPEWGKTVALDKAGLRSRRETVLNVKRALIRDWKGMMLGTVPNITEDDFNLEHPVFGPALKDFSQSQGLQ